MNKDIIKNIDDDIKEEWFILSRLKKSDKISIVIYTILYCIILYCIKIYS